MAGVFKGRSRQRLLNMARLTPHLIAQLLDEHADALELYAAQWCNSAADVVQDAFLQLVRQETLPERIAPWLYRVVRNRAISLARSQRRRTRHETAAAQEFENHLRPRQELAIDAGDVNAGLQELAEEEREVVVAHIWGGLTFEEIADIAGVSSSTAHRRYTNALWTLRERLGVTWLIQNSPTKK